MSRNTTINGDKAMNHKKATLWMAVMLFPFCGGGAGLAHAADGATGAVADDVVVAQQQEISVVEAFPEQELASSWAPAGNGERETLDVPVISWRDLPFQTVKRQALDYSCGSAAVSTLLTYVYGSKTSEANVFKAMFKAGDQKKIRREGFSLLDMSTYLKERGFNAVGYKITLDVIEKQKIPFIALINESGYNHFVVVKSIRGPRILVGDPNKGHVLFERAAFAKMWNGIALLIKNHARVARGVFDNPVEWTYAHSSVNPSHANYPGIDGTVLAPIQWQMAPTTTDIMAPVAAVISNTSLF